MYKDNKNGISVSTVLDKRIQHKGGVYPIRIVVTFKRDKKYYNTGKKATPEEWDKLFTSKSPALVKIRNSVKDSFDLIMDNVEELASEGRFTFDQLNVRIGQSSGGTINAALKVKIEELRKEERIGTMDYYKNVLRNIERYREKEVPFEDITPEWLRRYERHLQRNGNNYTSIGILMRGVRTMMNVAKKKGIISDAQYPFGKDKYVIREGDAKKKALTVRQLAAFAEFTDGNIMTEYYRDIWMFIYMCNGINVADLVNLKYRDIIDDEICFIREKTKRTTRTIKTIRAIVTPEMKEIISKLGNKTNPNNYIFPLIDHSDDPVIHAKRVKECIKQINRRTKMIGQALGIGRITTYTARHTFATVMKRGGASIAFISEGLGHSDIRTTEFYLDSFEKEEREKQASILNAYKKIS